MSQGSLMPVLPSVTAVFIRLLQPGLMELSLHNDYHIHHMSSIVYSKQNEQSVVSFHWVLHVHLLSDMLPVCSPQVALLLWSCLLEHFSGRCVCLAPRCPETSQTTISFLPNSWFDIIFKWLHNNLLSSPLHETFYELLHNHTMCFYTSARLLTRITVYFREMSLHSVLIFPAVIWYQLHDDEISLPFLSNILRKLFLASVTMGYMPISQFCTLGWFAVGCDLVLHCNQCEAWSKITVQYRLLLKVIIHFFELSLIDVHRNQEN